MGGKKDITVTLKLFSGLDKNVYLRDYDPLTGIRIHAKEGTRLKDILKSIGLTKISYNSYIINGIRISPRKRVKDGDDISCFRPTAGG